MQWLLNLAEKHLARLLSGVFYEELDSAASPSDISGWIRQLYYQSRDFISALSLRHATCRDLHFQSCFAQHAVEELDHCQQLIDWMHVYQFLQPNESPNSIPAKLETLSVSAYCFRSILRESPEHQVIALNLISEGVSYDFFSKVTPKLEKFGFSVGRYWKIHKQIDLQHLTMGLELIPPCEEDSPEGRNYALTIWEMSSFYGQMLDSWGVLSSKNRQAHYVHAS